MILTPGQRARIIAAGYCAQLPHVPQRPHRCSSGATSRTADARPRRYTTADNSSRRNSHERTNLLMPVQRVIGGVQIQNDLARRGAMRIEKQMNPQPLDPRSVRTDLVIAADALRCVQLQAVQRALARQRRAIASTLRLNLPSSAPNTASWRKQSWSLRSSYPKAMPNTRWPINVRTLCSTKLAARSSTKHCASRSINPIAASALPSSNAPASELTAPPSNAAHSATPHA